MLPQNKPQQLQTKGKPMNKKNYTTKKLPVKDVPKGTIFTDEDENGYYRIADLTSDKGTVVMAVVVEANTIKLERGDVATNLDKDQVVVAYFE